MAILGEIGIRSRDLSDLVVIVFLLCFPMYSITIVCMGWSACVATDV